MIAPEIAAFFVKEITKFSKSNTINFIADPDEIKRITPYRMKIFEECGNLLDVISLSYSTLEPIELDSSSESYQVRTKEVYFESQLLKHKKMLADKYNRILVMISEIDKSLKPHHFIKVTPRLNTCFGNASLYLSTYIVDLVSGEVLKYPFKNPPDSLIYKKGKRYFVNCESIQKHIKCLESQMFEGFMKRHHF